MSTTYRDRSPGLNVYSRVGYVTKISRSGFNDPISSVGFLLEKSRSVQCITNRFHLCAFVKIEQWSTHYIDESTTFSSFSSVSSATWFSASFIPLDRLVLQSKIRWTGLFHLSGSNITANPTIIRKAAANRKRLNVTSFMKISTTENRFEITDVISEKPVNIIWHQSCDLKRELGVEVSMKALYDFSNYKFDHSVLNRSLYKHQKWWRSAFTWREWNGIYRDIR